MIRHSRLPKRKIQKQRDALFVENMLLKMQVAMLEVQCQCIIADRKKPDGLAEGGIIVEQATIKFKDILTQQEKGPDAYEAKLPNPQ